MTVRYASLASGSKGNCHAIAEGGRTLLVDAGLSFLQLRKRLELLEWSLDEVAGVAITHEHSDHIAALPMILKKTSWTLLTTLETRKALERILGCTIPPERWLPLVPGKATRWDGWDVLPFATPHDAVDSVAFRLELGGRALAVATDLGHPTALVADHCRDLDLLVLESNHDVAMLREGDYPPPLKARILSRVGHLSNAAMAQLLDSVVGPRLTQVVLAHLSESNNAPELARLAAQEVLKDRAIALAVAQQREPLCLHVAG